MSLMLASMILLKELGRLAVLAVPSPARTAAIMACPGGALLGTQDETRCAWHVIAPHTDELASIGCCGNGRYPADTLPPDG